MLFQIIFNLLNSFRCLPSCLGYHACRMLAASTDVASVVGKGVAEKQHPDKIAADAYQAIWGKQNRGQRDFQVRDISLTHPNLIPCHLFHVVLFSNMDHFTLCHTHTSLLSQKIYLLSA